MSKDLGVRYGQTVKVTNPSDRYENSTFTVSYETFVPFSDPPENEKDYPAWAAERRRVLQEETAELRALADEEIQRDVDTFIKDNSPEEK